MLVSSCILLLLLLSRPLHAVTSLSGAAVTTQYWDCCKPSCSWPAKAAFDRPVLSCGPDDAGLVDDFTAGTGCNGGTAYACSAQSPWAVNDSFAYGFAGMFALRHVEDAWCCACYRLLFTTGVVEGKTMVVQVQNTAYDITTVNHFSLGIPGGNTTDHDGCARQFNVSPSVFGTRNQGINSRDDCDRLPAPLQLGCRWRFDWYLDALYPKSRLTRSRALSADSRQQDRLSSPG